MTHYTIQTNHGGTSEEEIGRARGRTYASLAEAAAEVEALNEEWDDDWGVRPELTIVEHN